MKDYYIAEEMLKNNNDISIVIVKDGFVIAKSSEKGVYALINIIKKHKRDLNGASMADKIVGKAVAVLAKDAGIISIYAKVISKPAMEYLNKKNVMVNKEKVVERILNRTKQDLCPIEKLTESLDDPEIIKKEIENFIKDKS